MNVDAWTQRISGNHDPLRDDFVRDRARVIHSAFFRRLQGKTQVLGLGESDFYRSRLTHSMEVAQISFGISEFLRYDNQSYEILLPGQNLIEVIGLAHDIGHPPFGHGGEVALNYCMRGSGGFEGNAQTLRIATVLGEYSESDGLDLTRRSLLGLMKYPVYYSDAVADGIYNESEAPLNLDSFKPPKCVFDEERSKVNWVLRPFSNKDKEIFTSTKQVDGKHKKPLYKSLDTSIMELADDIAYGVHDLEDAVALGLVTQSKWIEEVVQTVCSTMDGSGLSSEINELTAKIFSGVNRVRKSAISRLVNYFIRNCRLKKQDIFDHNILDLNAVLGEAARRELDVLKLFVVNNVIKTAEVQTLEYKGQQMVVRLFETIKANPSRLLPGKYYEMYKVANNPDRVVCDYLAGTTDEYATRLYHKIFTPSNGSIFDRL
jgi:dGTPase